MKYTRDSVKQTEYEQARRDYPHYAALCDAEDALGIAKVKLSRAGAYMTGTLPAHEAINAAKESVTALREELEKTVYSSIPPTGIFGEPL